ncbi:PH domain-containing protein [Microbacterium sp. zg.Y1090]|uniref:PH domain-containing protein n=1 Tax=Microbacterium wangruii TaxID=3049073 RepID=UPI00214D25DC|nr:MULTISPECIES: PH domain-containing protein [unclassified Microbacterium]MCR2819181.1 PH domain-containing protein [Microbacterium sp. zg.Y1090]MDL5487090.1 PH domain-containing protein [Microbacterium sp. zg-Y1211]WIM28165.1 PH domain-containing protein [Microbacterium sp. zg-Y1090]
MTDQPTAATPPAPGGVPGAPAGTAPLTTTATTADGLPVPPPALVRSPLSDGEWHRLHPLTPLLRGGLALIVIAGVVIANLRDRLIGLFVPGLSGGRADAEDWEEWQGGGDPIDFVLANNLLLVALAVVAGVVLLLIAGFYLSWRFHTFRITGDDVEVRSGILFRTQRRAPLDRVQGVNLTRPMIARLLGMAKLEVVGAGTDSNVKLEYLSTANAEAVRADILRLASGQRLGAAAVARGGGSLAQTVNRGLTGIIEGDDQQAEAPESVVHIPVGRLVASQVVSPSSVMLIVGVIAIIVASIVGTPWLLFTFVPALIGFGAYWVRQIVRSLRYSIAPTRDGVRITFGLLTTITEIIPPGRVHALEVSQSVLWRGFGWWTIKINRLTGRSAMESGADQFTTVLPVGTYADVQRVLQLLAPATSAEELPTLLQQGIAGPDGDDPFTTTPHRARIIRLLSWRRNGFLLTDELLLMRRGLIWRKLAILPLARLQSFGVYQGPIDRMLRVASVRGHIVTGPIYANVAAIDRGDAIALLEAVEDAAVRAAAADRSHRWAGESAEWGVAEPGAGERGAVAAANAAVAAAHGAGAAEHNPHGAFASGPTAVVAPDPGEPAAAEPDVNVVAPVRSRLRAVGVPVPEQPPMRPPVSESPPAQPPAPSRAVDPHDGAPSAGDPEAEHAGGVDFDEPRRWRLPDAHKPEDPR